MNKLIPVSVVIVLGAAAFWHFKSAPKAPKDMGAPVVKTHAPIIEKVTEWDEYTGRFQATQRVEIYARVSGFLQESLFKDGQHVEKGQTIFVIDPRPFQIAFDRAQANVVLAEKELLRSQKLFSTKFLAQEQVDQRTQAYQDAKGALDEARLNLEFSQVIAPISGHIGRSLVDPGNLVTGGGSADTTLLTTIVADDPINFYFEASEQDILKYMRAHGGKGQGLSALNGTKNVQVKLLDEEDFTHHGSIDFVDNELDPSSGTMQVRAVFPNQHQTLVPGFYGRLRVAGREDNTAMLIPDEAVGTNQTQKIVFKVTAQGVVVPHPVVLGPLHEGKWRIVRSGLGPKDQIIWSGIARVRPGLTVKTQEITNSIDHKGAPTTRHPQEKKVS